MLVWFDELSENLPAFVTVLGNDIHSLISHALELRENELIVIVQHLFVKGNHI